MEQKRQQTNKQKQTNKQTKTVIKNENFFLKKHSKQTQTKRTKKKKVETDCKKSNY